MRNKRVSSLAIAALISGAAAAQLTISTALTPQQLVQDVLLGTGVTVSNVTYNGVPSPGTPQDGSGSFTSVPGSFEIPAGVILSSGFATSITNPEPGITSDFTNTGGDDDLLTIITEFGGNESNDRAVLEFDFVPMGDSIKFNYIFASEEYPNFNCSPTFNDVFGFFLSGPGIVGPYTNNAINIALVPGTTLPVSISNVHGPEGGFGCDPINEQYYIHNAGGTIIMHGGYTTPLTALAAVTCGQVYHIKLAISDAGDTAYDSAVFLEAGSFQSAPFIPSLTPGPGIVGNNISESCFPMGMSFVRIGDTVDADTVQVVYGGTATMGVDLVPGFPVEVIFPAGVDTIPFIFNAPIDADGAEDITITVSTFSDCTGDTITNTFVFIIDAPPPLEITSPPFSVDCGASIEIGAIPTGGYGLYNYDWGGGVTDSSIVVSPLVDTNYPITVTDTCGVASTYEVPVTVVDVPNPFSAYLTPGLTVSDNNVQESCYEVTLNIVRNGGTAFEEIALLTFMGNATAGVDYTMPPTQVTFPVGVSEVSIPLTVPQDADGLEQVIVMMGYTSPCSGEVSQATYAFTITQAPELIATGDVVVIPCEGNTDLTVTYTGGYTPYEILWSNGLGTNATVNVGPLAPTTYTATITDDCNNVSVATFNVDLLDPNPLILQIMGASTVVEGCTNTQINLIRPQGVVGALDIDMSYTGTASNGSDYVLANPITIPEDLLNVIFSFDPAQDNDTEGSENAVITASYTDACGRTVTATVTVIIEDAPPIVLMTEDIQTECQPDTVPITVVATGGYGDLNIVWSTGDVGNVAWVTLQSGGTYSVTVTDECGRTATDQVEVVIDCDVVIPNVFTPNGDGENDVFFVEGITYSANELRIYNRWGQVVYEATNYKNTWKADGIPDGTYFYEILVHRHDEPYTGHLTILRNGW